MLYNYSINTMTDNYIPKLTIHQKAQILKDNQHLYSKEKLMYLANEWEKDYHKYLMSNLKVLSSH